MFVEKNALDGAGVLPDSRLDILGALHQLRDPVLWASPELVFAVFDFKRVSLFVRGSNAVFHGGYFRLFQTPFLSLSFRLGRVFDYSRGSALFKKMSAKKRQTIAAVIMTKNCEGLVEGTLKSIASWVDEIVVVDGFSTDRTVDIRRRYTPKVFQNRWDGYRFCTERNLGNEKAAKDWCLHIDPDERVTPEFKNAVSTAATSMCRWNAT